MLKKIFYNRFCWGWCSAFIIVGMLDVFNLYKWWQFVPVIIVSYLSLRYFAFKYFDE